MLLEAARSVIADRGLHATTLRDIAAAGDVAVGTVTYHFAGIAEVLAGVLDSEMVDYSGPIMRAAEQAPTGREALQCIVNGLVADGRRAHEHWKLWLDFWALSAHDDRYAGWQTKVYQELHSLVAACRRRGIGDGSITVSAIGDPGQQTDPADWAVRFVALLDGLVVQCYLPGSIITCAQARSVLLASCR